MRANHESRNRLAFTIVELLIVFAIIAILIALLLPAIQQAREAARMTECQARLRQIAQGLHNYHAARRQFPAGSVARDENLCNGFLTQDGMNWMIAVLPYVEEEGLWRSYNDAQYNEAPENESVRQTTVRIYNCPSEFSEVLSRVPSKGPAAADAMNLPYAIASYRGVSGRSQGTVFLDSASATNYPIRYRGVLHVVNFQQFWPERFSTVKDGSSNTLMVGESTTINNPGMGTLWAYSFTFYPLSAITEQSRTFSGDYDRCVAQAGTGLELPCQRGWGSTHPTTIDFALVDGSVRPFSKSVDLRLFARLATIDGSEPSVSGL